MKEMSSLSDMENQPKPGENKSFEPSSSSWVELSKMAHDTTDANLRTQCFNVMKSRIDYAEKEGLIDKNAMARDIVFICREGRWQEDSRDNFYDKLKEAGYSMEEQNRKTKGGIYANNEEFTNMAQDLYGAIARQISAQNLLNVRGIDSNVPVEAWSDSQWKLIGKKVLPGSGDNVDIKEAKRIYLQRKAYADADFASLLKLDVDHLSRLIGGNTPEEQKTVEEHAQRMQDYNSTSQERAVVSPLEGKRFGAFFKGSVINSYAADTRAPRDPNTGERVRLPGYNLENAEDRQKWLNDTLYAFRGPRGPSVTQAWRTQLAYYRNDDIWSAYSTIERKTFDGVNEGTPEYQIAQNKMDSLYKDVKDLEQELIRHIAIHVAVMCNEDSGGSGTSYSQNLLGGERGPALDEVDIIGSELLLQEREDFWYDTLGEEGTPLHDAYDNILNEMGLEVVESHYEYTKDVKNKIGVILHKKGDWVDYNDVDPNQHKFVGSDVVRVLLDAKDFNNKKDGEYTNKLHRNLSNGKGVNGWIEDTLAEQEAAAKKAGTVLPNRKERWLQLKTAWDLILADGKATRWVAMLQDNEKFDDIGMAKFSQGWGGDALMALQKPSNLVRNVKKMYSNEDGVVLDLLDEGCRPEKYCRDENERKKFLRQVSLVGTGTKAFARYSDMVYQIFGGDSRGTGIADLDKIGIEQFQKALDYLDQLNGGKKELTGYQAMTWLEAKALAITLSSGEPTLKQRTFDKLFIPDDVRSWPNSEKLQFLLGPNVDGQSGYLSKIMGGQMRIKIEGAGRDRMNKAISLLKSDDQNDFWRGVGELLNILGFGLDVLAGVGGLAVMAVGLDEFLPKKEKKRS